MRLHILIVLCQFLLRLVASYSVQSAAIPALDSAPRRVRATCLSSSGVSAIVHGSAPSVQSVLISEQFYMSFEIFWT